MIIRRELPGDAGAVSALHDAAFGARAGERAVESRLVEELRRAGDDIPQLCLVALEDADVVGHVMCSRGHVGELGLVALGPIGVLPARQRAGVGAALVHAVLGGADALNEAAVFLLGEPDYYARFGFVPAAEHGVAAPDPAWGRYFQVRPLAAWNPVCTGAFRYPAAFDEL